MYFSCTMINPLRAIPVPLFPGEPRKNDALFMYGAISPKPVVFCYEQETIEVVHGPACRPEGEVDLAACTRDGVRIQQRRGGGGSVVLSPGMVITLVVGSRRKEDSIRDHFNRIHRAMVELLDPNDSLAIRHCGISDLAIGGRKILGSSLYLTQTPFHFYYQSSLMVNSDPALISRYLRHPPREPDYRGGRDHGSFCTTLHQEGYKLTPERILCLFGEGLADRLDWSR